MTDENTPTCTRNDCTDPQHFPDADDPYCYDHSVSTYFRNKPINEVYR